MSALASRKLLAPADPRGAFDVLYRRGCTDGLPVIPPTEALVREMLGSGDFDPAEPIAVLAPSEVPVSAEKAAINAVMVGCLPEYFPVVVAALQAIAHPDFNLLGIQTTTNPVTPVLVINGPIRQTIDVNCGRGCLGPGWRANATIGRAVRLALLNLAGAVPGEIDKASHGMPGKFSFCFGELEEESPWAPLHVERGLGAGQSAVTAFAGQGTANCLALYLQPENIVHVVADLMRCYGYNGYRHHWGNPLVVMGPGHARIFADAGWDKDRIRAELFARARVRRGDLPDERLLVGASYDDLDPDAWVEPCRDPADITLVVAGGPEAYHIVYIPSFGHTDPCTVALRAAGG